jgi:serine/threonine protein kinase
MHEHHIAHLDISVHNILTDDRGHFAYIDYESSQMFDSSISNPQTQVHRATELPPEYERGEPSDPYKSDIWALAVLILRACQVYSNITTVILFT